MGRHDVGGQPLGRRQRVVQPHREITRVERDPGDVGVDLPEDVQQLARGQVGVGLDRQADAAILQPRRELVDHRAVAATWSGQGASVRKRSWRSPT